jgi:hypothetical protein
MYLLSGDQGPSNRRARAVSAEGLDFPNTVSDTGNGEHP